MGLSRILMKHITYVRTDHWKNCKISNCPVLLDMANDLEKMECSLKTFVDSGKVARSETQKSVVALQAKLDVVTLEMISTLRTLRIQDGQN